MKKMLLLATAALALTACNPPSTDVTRTLTVKVEGVATAPVQVTNADGTVLLNGNATSDGTKITKIKDGSTVKVVPQAVAGYTTPAAQTVVMDSDKTVTLKYEAIPAYNATGNWLLTLEVIDTTYGNRSYTAPNTLPIEMTNSITGDFKVDYPVNGVTTNVMTGNTATGKIHLALGSTVDGKIGWADCYGAFNTSQNTYLATCYPENSTPAERATLDASGNKTTLSMTRK